MNNYYTRALASLAIVWGLSGIVGCGTSQTCTEKTQERAAAQNNIGEFGNKVVFGPLIDFIRAIDQEANGAYQKKHNKQRFLP